MKTGIMGGTFNPIHHGHLIMAEQIKEAIGLDRVIFVPCYLPPHKSGENVIESSHRLKMIELAIKDNSYFSVSDIEIKRKEVSYSIDMINNFKKLYPDDDFFFLIGEDSLLDLHTWKDINNLLDICTFVTAKRSCNKELEMQFKSNNSLFNKKNMEKLIDNIVQTNVITLSSSEIREKIKNEQSLSYIVPKNVQLYIKEKNLYR